MIARKRKATPEAKRFARAVVQLGKAIEEAQPRKSRIPATCGKCDMETMCHNANSPMERPPATCPKKRRAK